MPEIKEKVHLVAEQETLMITLYAKTRGSPPGWFVDPAAWKIIEAVDYDFSQLKVKTGTRLTVCLRAMKIDREICKFLCAVPYGVVLHLGCGLDTRFTRVDDGKVIWYDLDLPAVMELRRKFFAEDERYHMIASSVTDWGWLDQVKAGGKVVFVAAEGLLMYLSPADVKELVTRLQAAFPGCRLVFDAFSTLTARSVHRNASLDKTGAVIQWGIDDPRVIESWAPGACLNEEWYFDQAEEIAGLSSGYRLMFKVSGLFAVARKAHRILDFSL